MFLREFKVMNLWSDSSVELSFAKNVTILTGINGSGKSSILNIIYDSLNFKSAEYLTTSKNRLWVSECTLENDIVLQSMALPPVPQEKQTEIESSIIKYRKDNGPHTVLYNQKLIDEVKEVYDDGKALNHIVFSKGNIEGEGFVNAFDFPDSYTEEQIEEGRKALRERPNAFLFQEDRKVMHNLDNSNIDPNLEFWATYSTSIDTRFFYIRDAMQIRESQIDSERSKILDDFEGVGDFDGHRNDPRYKKVINDKKSIADLYSLLNIYFSESGKSIVKDKDDNKVTLKNSANDTPISWHLLSRGEKTIIYLFFSVFLYKDKVSMFLLDEPDVALHINWQENLIKDITSIAPEHQFVIATHSPGLVMNGWMNNCKEIAI
ncbi:AAA family ATPase [Vibrio sp. 10N.237.312.B06]|uniref:AAA family ATPase n=1 Tax=Vibrio sp. 10N.237.312.B06 TaxID=3229974 RepID=UPI00354EF0F1